MFVFVMPSRHPWMSYQQGFCSLSICTLQLQKLWTLRSSLSVFLHANTTDLPSSLKYQRPTGWRHQFLNSRTYRTAVASSSPGVFECQELSFDNLCIFKDDESRDHTLYLSCVNYCVCIRMRTYVCMYVRGGFTSMWHPGPENTFSCIMHVTLG